MMEDNYRHNLIERRKVVQSVVDQFRGSPLYETIKQDSVDGIEKLDQCWTDVVLSGKNEQLINSVVLKLAARHVIALPDRYEAELKRIDEELEAEDNEGEITQKDYDTESNYE